MKKKVITVVITVLLGIICIMPFRHVMAESFTGNEFVYYHVSNNIRGSASGYRDSTADYYIYNDPTNLKYRGVVHINFDGPVNGTFTLGIPVQFNSSDVVVTENCVVQTNSSTGVWTFKVNGVESCTVEYYTVTTSRGVSSFSGTWTKASDLDDINTTLGQIKGYVDGVESTLNTISNTLSTISTNLNTTNSLLYQVIQLQQYSSYFPSYNIAGYLWGISYGGYSTYNQSSMPFANMGNSYNDGTYTNIHRILKRKDKDCVLYFIADYWVSNSAINILWQDNRFNSSFNIEVKQWYSSDNPNAYHALYLCKLTVSSDNTFDNGFEIEFNLNSLKVYPLYIGTPDMLPDELALLLGIDFNNTYTRLLEQINQGIKDLSFVNNTTQTTINSNVNNYNDYTTEIHNIENNYINQFNNYKDDIITPTLPTAITNDITNYKTFIDGFFNGVPYIKTILSVILFCFLIICLLGV